MSNSVNQKNRTFFIDTEDINEVTIDTLKELIADIDTIYDARNQLKDKIELANKKKEAYSVVCTQDTTTAVNTAISEANTILANDNVTADEINAKNLALTKAITLYLLSRGADVICGFSKEYFTVSTQEALGPKTLNVYNSINADSITQIDADNNMTEIQTALDALEKRDPNAHVNLPETVTHEMLTVKYVAGRIRLACTNCCNYTPQAKSRLLSTLDKYESAVKDINSCDDPETTINNGYREISQALTYAITHLADIKPDPVEVNPEF